MIYNATRRERFSIAIRKFNCVSVVMIPESEILTIFEIYVVHLVVVSQLLLLEVITAVFS